MDMSADRLVVKYDMDGPADLDALGASFDGIASEYRRLLERRGLKPSDLDAKLYLTRIEMGCVEAEIGAAAWALGQTMATMDYALIFADMTDRIKQVLDWAGRDSAEKPADLTATECRDLKNFLGAVTGRVKSRLGVRHARFFKDEETATFKRRIIAEMSLDEPEIDRADRMLEKEIEDLTSKEQATYRTVQNVQMRLWQANAGEARSGARSADLAIISKVLERPLQLFFLPHALALKSKLIDVTGNILHMAFIVDVHVKYESGRPRSYTLLDVHGHIEDEEETEPSVKT
jgi:hypothetical protein